MIESKGLFCLKVVLLYVQLTNAEHSCNFNYGLCFGWRQNYLDDDFDWTNQYGSTSSSSTGPSSDHGGYGRYMYIETSSPRYYGDNAKLEYSVSNTDIGELSCLEFYYHMYGTDVNTLNVFNGNTRVFTQSGNRGNQWLKAKVTMSLGSKVTFEGISGTSFRGDIAIDDVSITAGICQGCTENVNKSFGRLDITYASKFDPYCNWIISHTGKTQAVAIVAINQIYFAYSSEYIKIFDGNGSEVFALSGWLSSSKKTIHEISFGESKNITIQVALVYSWSYVKIDYGILNQGLDSAFPLADLNVTVVNRTTNSIEIIWNNPIHGVRFYVALAKTSNSSSEPIGKIVPGNTTTSEITDLQAYTEYNVSVVAMNTNGTQLKTADVLVSTDEGVPSRAPNLLRVTSFEFTSDLLVEWSPLSQNFVNGKLLGYRIYYRESSYYWSAYQTVNTSSPYPTHAKLKDLKPGQQYRVYVAAYTSKGEGPWTYGYYATTGCSIAFNESFGHIDYTGTNYNYLRCSWIIQNGGIREAIALISVQEINLQYCSEYAKITVGNSTEVLYHSGCTGPFAPEILTDVHFGLSNNITVQVYTGSSSSNINIKFAILKKGLTSAILVAGWNLTILNADSSSFILQWSGLDANVNRRAGFYLIEVKSAERVLLAVETVPGNTSSTNIKGLSPSSTYRVVIFGVDEIGQPYKSLESVVTMKAVFCGVRPSLSRIVGGTVAQVNSWPWQAMLVNSYGSQFCGGSLVDEYWVVTAAHCVNGKLPSSIKIRLGAHYRTSSSVGTEQDIGVAKIIVHEKYNYLITYSNDIALLHLASPAGIGVGVGLVCLPETNHQLPLDDTTKNCWITGWGSTYSGGPSANSLMQAEVPLVSKHRCEISYPYQIDDSMLCAGLDAGQVDSCQGDSGGPLVCEFNGTWYLEGATSWGYGCAIAEKYGVYSKIRHLKSWLLRNMYNVVPPSASTPVQSPSTLAWCNFDHGLCSGWNQSSSDDFDWTLASGSTPSSSTGPGSGQGGSGKYMYIEASSPRKPGENAKLVLTVPDNGKHSCLSFYYHMYGASAGTLNVYNGNHTIFNVSGDQGNNWHIVEREVSLDREIIFEGITGSSYTGDVAIDQVNVTEGKCPVSCSFDSGLCLGWSQSKSDVFDWTLNSWSTPSSGTGPSSDHGGSGKYMYIEALYWSSGDNAKLQLAVPRAESYSCLIFYYHMYGYSMGTLNVFNGNVKIFTKSGNQGYYWKKVSRTLQLSDVLTFEGIRGSSYRSDIAIDDVTVLGGNCPGCGGVLNESFGEVDIGNSGDDGDSHCNWTIGGAGIRQAVAIISLQRIYFGYCSEYIKILHSTGTEVFNHTGCQSSLPYGTSLEVPIGTTDHIILEIVLEYRWSAVNLQYDILSQGLDSASQVSWNITVYSITSSSASVRWLNFPLSANVTHYLVRYKEPSGVSVLFRASSYSNTHYTNLLKGYTSYDVQVFASTTGIDGNITYSSQTVSIETPEGVPSRAPTNVQVSNHGLNEFLVQWDPVPIQYVNGLLLGYTVYYKDTQYYYSLEKADNTSDPDEPHVILTGIQTGQRYQISVAAFTSKGHGPRSSYLYITKGCEGFVNQSSGWLNFTKTDYNTLYCSVEIRNAGMQHGVVLISFQYVYLGYCSESVKIFDSQGVEVYGRRGCNSIASGLTIEVPYSGGRSITLAASMSYRYSYVRVQYTILNQALASAQQLPSWNLTVTNATSSSLTVKWAQFPLTNLFIQRFLVNYREHSSNVSLIFEVPNSYDTHYTGSVLKGYQFYDVQVIAVETSVGNSTYSSQKQSTRTIEGVPSSEPSNVTLKNLKFDEVIVEWDPIPQHTANGVLLGYVVYLYEYSYWYYTLKNTVNTSSPSVHKVILRGLKAVQSYRISVAAFTSKGAGPQSYWRYITTGCGGYLNQSFGQLHVDDYRGSSYVNCNWEIGSVGISQAVAFVWIQELYLYYYYEYLRILNGNGSIVLNEYGYSSVAQTTFLEVDFGKANNITIQVSLSNYYSHFKLQYGIMKQGIQSALLVPNWNVTVENTTTRSIKVNWKNLTPVINKMVLYYIVQMRNQNGSDVLNALVVNGSATYVDVTGLSPYTEYQVSVVGVSSDGQPYKSSNVTALTEEGVPSRGPSNLRLSNLQSGEVKVQWEPLSQQYANGQLLGYSIYVYEYDYYANHIKTVHSNSASVHMVIVRGLKAAQRYRISVAAFTSKGVGPQSYYAYITTVCGGSTNQSFGELQVSPRSYYSYYLQCNWAIGSAGINKAVLVVSLQELYLSYSYEYIKITDGNGSIAFYHSGYSSSPWKTFLEVNYGNATNVTIEIYLAHYWSQFKLQYGIVQQGLQSAPLIANWSVSVDNTTKKSITIRWPNLTPILNQPVLHYFGLIKSRNGTIVNCHIMSANTSYVAFTGLQPYREYRLSVVGVNNIGEAYRSAEVTVWTEEGVPSRAPSNITFTAVKSTEVTVNWNPLLEQYANGRLLGYEVYFQETAYYSSSSNTNSVNVTTNSTTVTFTGLRPGQRYYTYIFAFTSKGVGPRSYFYYITTACKITINHSAGLIDVTQTDYNYLYCSWTVQNVGITHAVALFIIQRLDLSYCSEFVKISDGNGTTKYYQTAASCWYSFTPPFVEVPFGKSNNITVNINLRKLHSLAKVQFVILKNGLKSAALFSSWVVSVDNTTSTSILVQWANLTSLINRKVLHYIIFLNETNVNTLAYEVTDGSRLSTEIDGLKHRTNYEVTVFGVDELGGPYKTLEVNATTKNISCGSRPSSSRIVGGSIAPINSWPWQAMLLDSSDRQFCGGSLIDLLWVVTATHCIYGKSASSVKVRLGAHYRSYGTVGTEQDFDVVKIIQHESYNIPFSWSNDIALLQLSKPAKLGKGVGLVCLSDNEFQLPFDDVNKTCWITGWGTLSYLGITPNELMQVDVPLVSEQRCNASYPGQIDDSMMCIGHDHGGEGACHGDSGGPLVCEFNGKWYLEGATSWGGLPCAAPSKYTVYANIRNLKSWIKNKIHQEASTPALASCDFDLGLCSGWQQSYSDVFDWTLRAGSTSSSNTGPSSDHTSGSGYYMYIETSSPRVAGDNAKLILSVADNQQLSCLRFYYHMYGYTMGTLTVFSGNLAVFNASGDHGNYWFEENVNIYLDGDVTFEGIRGSSYTGDVAIDDVSIRSGSCFGQTVAPSTFPTGTTYVPSSGLPTSGLPSISVGSSTHNPSVLPTSSPAAIPGNASCDFDYGLCSGWRQSDSDDFDWKRHTGSTTSYNTGPNNDHTSGEGYYMYIETSSPRVPGDVAKLTLSVPGNKKLSCLTFYYHMYGETIGVLTVFSGSSVVFEASGNHGNSWKEAKIDIHLDSDVTFEGIRGSSFTGDLAIDDVSISNGSCFGQTSAPPTFLPVSTDDPSSGLPSSVLPQLNSTTSSTHNQSAPPTTSPGCSDKPGFLNCASLPHYGNFCTVHSNLTREYCAKSCGFCGVECSDDPKFAAMCLSLSSYKDACLTQLNWTIEHCRRSCGFCLDDQDNPPTTYLAPQTPSNESVQESVMLEIQGLDMTKWDEQMKNDFKSEVARVATDYCSAFETRCQSNATSSRRRRSSDEMVFSGNMVHIIQGYPVQSPENDRIALLAFYMQLPEGFSENVVPKDVLIDMVNSNMSSIGGSMNGTILSVQSLVTSSPDTFKGEETDDESDEGSKPKSATSVIIGASIGGVLFFLLIVALVLTFKKSQNRRVRNEERVDEGVVEGNEAIPGEVDGTEAIKKSPKDAYCKRRFAFEKRAAELERDNPTHAFQNVPDKEIEEQCPSTSADLHVITTQPPSNDKRQSLESVRNIGEETPTTSTKLERNEVEGNSTDDGIVLGSKPVPKAEKEDRTGTSDETLNDGPMQQDEIGKGVGGNVVVV